MARQLVGHKMESYSKEESTRTSRSLTYSPCLNCKRHPHYPNIPAVTLHLEGICVICDIFR